MIPNTCIIRIAMYVYYTYVGASLLAWYLFESAEVIPELNTPVLKEGSSAGKKGLIDEDIKAH